MSEGLDTEATLQALLDGREVSRLRLEVAYADMLLIRAERDRYHGLLAEGLAPRPAGVSDVEWLGDWIERIREALV